MIDFMFYGLVVLIIGVPIIAMLIYVHNLRVKNAEDVI